MRRYGKAIGSVAMFLLAHGCAAGAGGTGGAASTTATSGSGQDTSAWRGTWTGSSSVQEMCGASGVDTTIITWSVTSDTTAGKIDVAGPGCNLVFDVTGLKATLDAGATCQMPYMGSQVTVMWTQGIATLSQASGTMSRMSLNLTGTTNSGCAVTATPLFTM